MTVYHKGTLLVSACLLGQRVRYDGNHAQLTDGELLVRLRAKFTVIPICPEILGGLPTPRPAAEITHQSDRIEVVDCNGKSETAAFIKGAKEVCNLARQYHVTHVLLKSKALLVDAT